MRTNLAIVAMLLTCALSACGDDDAPKADAEPSGGPDAAVVDAAPGTPDAEVPDAEPAEFAITSTAIHGDELLDAKYTCAGDNVSPPLMWTAGPAGTKSYAVAFIDVNNATHPFNHSVIWDIPPSVLALPEAVERVAMPSVPAGAKQAKAYDNIFGYSGPCPNGNTHHYEFTLYALDVATLPDVTTSTNRDTVIDALEGAHKLARVTVGTNSNAQN
jgi:Raf kinase inhibitor-like YbhB/YbcL family protein